VAGRIIDWGGGRGVLTTIHKGDRSFQEKRLKPRPCESHGPGTKRRVFLEREGRRGKTGPPCLPEKGLGDLKQGSFKARGVGNLSLKRKEAAWIHRK